MIWASDFPHNDAKYPGVVDELREHNDGLPEADRRALYGLNASEMYDIAV
jgi:predicted TIM-barrel fold metal-dependent hydrolase